MSTRDVSLVIGGEPRIDFLAPEVKAGKQARRTRRSLAALVILVVAASAGGYLFATSLAVQAQDKLSAAQDRTRALIQEQGEYQEVRAVTGELISVQNARLVGSAPEVLWRDYVAKLVAVLPSGTTIDSFSVTSQPANEARPTTEVPLQNARMATVNFVAAFPGLADAKTILEKLEDLPGFADAWATPIEVADDAYTASFTLNINSDVLERRFFVSDEEGAAEADATAQTDGEG